MREKWLLRILNKRPLLEEVSKRQGSRKIWLKEGDKKTLFSTGWPIRIEEEIT